MLLQKPFPAGSLSFFLTAECRVSGCASPLFIEWLGQAVLDDAGVDRLGPISNPALNAHQVLANLQRGLELGREQRGRLVGDGIVGCHARVERSLEHPVDAVTLSVAQTAERTQWCGRRSPPLSAHAA